MISRVARPFHLMIKPTGAACDLACEYCYYREKVAYYPGSSFRMSYDTLERVTAAYLQSHPDGEVVFGWQGGEPLLMGLDFYRRALELQAAYARAGQRVTNSLQTNGTLVNDEWAAFFAEHRFLVGISIDGPPGLHDCYRRKAGGGGSYPGVLSGLKALQRQGAECNALVTVNRANAESPLVVYRHLTGLGLQHVQFIPVVEWQSASSRKLTPYSVRAEALGEFLCEVFDYWARHDVGRVFVQLFETTLSAWLGHAPSLCVFAPTCGAALVVEHNGDLYACDHFVYPEHLRGRVGPETLKLLVEGREQTEFGLAKGNVSQQCQECSVLRFCYGDCPKHRLRRAQDGQPISYLCAAYRRFFTHSAQVLRAMALEISAGRPAANVMEVLRAGQGEVGSVSPALSAVQEARRSPPK